jgi:Ankyrin repeats (3 copies)/Ankyrin repeats (many copies)
MREFFEAIQAGDRNRVRELIAGRPELLRALRPDGATPVLFAKYIGQIPVLDELVSLSPGLSVFEAAAVGVLPPLERAVTEDPEALHNFSGDGWSALHLACFFGHQAAVSFLLARGANLEVKSKNMLNNRPLHAAASGRHTAVCVELLRRGANADAQQHGGYTALHSAAQHGNEALVDVLLAAGASLSLADGQGRNAAQHAEEKGHRALAERL